MFVDISNCNNIHQGRIDIVEGALNVKYAINGTGKSTIARALSAKITQDATQLSALKPYASLSDETVIPSVNGCDSFSSVMTFDEKYIEQYVYQDELLKDSFEIFVKTPDYERHIGEINQLLSDIGETFRNNPELEELISLFNSFIDGCGKSATGISAAGAIAKAFGKGNKIDNIPNGLERYETYLSNTESGENVKWIKWQTEGKHFLEMADQCPYCTASVEETKETILKVSSEYDTKAVDHLNKMLSVFESLSAYFSDSTNEQIQQITNNVNNMTSAEKNYIFEIKQQVVELNNQLLRLKNIGYQSLKNVEHMVEHIRAYRINLDLFSHLQSELTREKINAINATLDEVEVKAGRLQGEVNQQNNLIRNTIQENSAAINNFLRCAGYCYEVKIVEGEADKPYKMMLYPTGMDINVDSAKNRLSYGERNALALVLFMFSALKNNPDLIILDDPISSFDGNKKFAILNMLFMSDRCLRNRSVLLLTHEFNSVIDIISTMHHKISPAPHAAFLKTVGGILTEEEICKSDIMPFKKIALANIENANENLNKLVYLRRLYEIEGEKGMAWQLLSNLFHNNNRPVPTVQENGASREMTDAEREEGTRVIQTYVPDFDYSVEFAKTQDISLMKSLYENSDSNYEKLQLYRVMYNENNDNPVVKKYVNEVFHVENDYLYQLNPRKYDTVPQFVIDECTADINGIVEL